MVSFLVTANSNWPPVVGVTEMVMLGPGQPHPDEHGQVSLAVSILKAHSLEHYKRPHFFTQGLQIWGKGVIAR